MFVITNKSVNKAIDYILRHLNEEVSVGDVAALSFFQISFQQNVQGGNGGERVCIYKAAQTGTERIPAENRAESGGDGHRI